MQKNYYKHNTHLKFKYRIVQNFDGGNVHGLASCFIQKFDGENVDRLSLREPVLTIQLENSKRKNFDGLLAQHQIRQCFPSIKIFCFTICY